MADKTTQTGSLTLRGIVPPEDARAQRRKYWEGQLALAQKQLARADSDVEVTYWQGAAALAALLDRAGIALPETLPWGVPATAAVGAGRALLNTLNQPEGD